MKRVVPIWQSVKCFRFSFELSVNSSAKQLWSQFIFLRATSSVELWFFSVEQSSRNSEGLCLFEEPVAVGPQRVACSDGLLWLCCNRHRWTAFANDSEAAVSVGSEDRDSSESFVSGTSSFCFFCGCLFGSSALSEWTRFLPLTRKSPLRKSLNKFRRIPHILL